MRPDDVIRIRHMVEAVREALQFVSGRTREDLNDDRMLALSLIKELEIIGEASNRVSNETQLAIDTIPWLDIIDMRNHLVHGYFDVDYDLVWDTVMNDLPPLLAELEKTLSRI
jgi:uncharacterized protein with HEPN domain